VFTDLSEPFPRASIQCLRPALPRSFPQGFLHLSSSLPLPRSSGLLISSVEFLILVFCFLKELAASFYPATCDPQIQLPDFVFYFLPPFLRHIGSNRHPSDRPPPYLVKRWQDPSSLYFMASSPIFNVFPSLAFLQRGSELSLLLGPAFHLPSPVFPVAHHQLRACADASSLFLWASLFTPSPLVIETPTRLSSTEAPSGALHRQTTFGLSCPFLIVTTHPPPPGRLGSMILFAKGPGSLQNTVVAHERVHSITPRPIGPTLSHTSTVLPFMS